MPEFETPHEKEPPFYRALLAGGIAGTTVDVSLYPIDTLKTRLQSAKGFTASGGFRGIYAGVGSAIVGSAPGAALFFVTYESSKRLFRNYRELNETSLHGDVSPHWIEPVEHMVAASLGEIAACAVRVPTEVVKQRAQASRHPSSFAVLKEILSRRKLHGVAGVWQELYRGWTITVLREVPFTVIQFPLWESMRKWRSGRMGRTYNTGGESAIFGCISGAIAGALTTPLDVLKTRIMLAQDKHSLLSMTRKVLKESGFRAFFSGLGPRVSWIAAGGAIFLGSYQWACNLLTGVL